MQGEILRPDIATPMPLNSLPVFVMVTHTSAHEVCCSVSCVVRIATMEVSQKNCQFLCSRRGGEELKNLGKSLPLLKLQLFFKLNNIGGMSAISFEIPAMWSVNKGDVGNVCYRSDSTWRILTDALDLFVTIFQSMQLLVCCLSTRPHACILGVPPLLPVQYIPPIRLSYLSLKLIV